MKSNQEEKGELERSEKSFQWNMERINFVFD